MSWTRSLAWRLAPRIATLAIGVSLAGPLALSPAMAEDPPGADVTAVFRGAPPGTLAELREMEARQQSLAEKAIAVTVGVRIGPAQGSGVIITSDGYVLTAAHVAQKPNLRVEFRFPDGTQAHGITLGMNRDIDAGLMKITDEREGGWPHAEMGDYDSLQRGHWVMVTGHPGGYEKGRRPVVRVGRVLRKQATVLVTDCPLIGGDSGGPLFDMDGKVVGIHSRIGGSLTANMHVPIDTYQETWDQLVAGKLWGRVPPGAPVIGVSGTPADSGGARIDRVTAGGPADKAGFKPGDIVTRFGRQTIDDFETLILAVSRQTPGDKVRVTVRRDAKEIQLTLEIGVKR